MSRPNYHKHHIIPFHEWKKRINPSATRRDVEFNKGDNVVWLTVQQHIQCHQWLWENMASKKDHLASLVLSGSIKIEEFRSQLAKLSWLNRSRTMSVDQRMKMSVIMRGNQRAKGNVFSQEQRQKVSLSRLGRKRGKYKLETKCRITKGKTQKLQASS